MQKIIGIVERLRPALERLNRKSLLAQQYFIGESWRNQSLLVRSGPGLRSPGPDLVNKLIGLIHDSCLTYMLHMITQTRRTRAGSDRLTVNVIRNQQRNPGPDLAYIIVVNCMSLLLYCCDLILICVSRAKAGRRTLNETNIASPQAIEYGSPPLVGLRQSFDRYNFRS